MIYHSQELEHNAIMAAAQAMCAAARTAPKAKGMDMLETCVVTGDDLETIAAEIDRLGDLCGSGFFHRDANNVRASQAVVLIGSREQRRGLGESCCLCHFKGCAGCEEAGGMCFFDALDLGIAVGSAAAQAADFRVDNRIMFTVGQAGKSLGLLGEGVNLVIGIPMSITGKSPFFDRKR